MIPRIRYLLSLTGPDPSIFLQIRIRSLPSAVLLKILTKLEFTKIYLFFLKFLVSIISKKIKNKNTLNSLTSWSTEEKSKVMIRNQKSVVQIRGFESRSTSNRTGNAVHRFVRLFVRSFVCSFVHSFVHSFIPSFLRSFIHSFILFLVTRNIKMSTCFMTWWEGKEVSLSLSTR